LIQGNGNDTIDRYPLYCGAVEKILCITERTFKVIKEDFNAFCRHATSRVKTRSSNVGPKNRLICKPIPRVFNERRFRDYEPTQAIYFNGCDWRRWIRVKEWFGQHAQGAEEHIFQKTILTE